MDIEDHLKQMRQANKDGFCFGLFIGALVMLLFTMMVTTVKADDSPPHTAILVCTGGLPSLSVRDNAQGGCKHVGISATDVQHADHVSYEAQAFSHVYYMGGDEACIATGYVKDHHTVLDSGRDCNEDHKQCAYIAEGFGIYAITGQSCLEAGVPLCTGAFCR